MKCRSLIRVLALDLHPRRFGYVVLERPDRLLDWGVCSYRGKGRPTDALLHRRLRPLLELWRPTVLVIGARQMPPRRKLLRVRLIKSVVAEAKTYRVHVRLLRLARERTEKRGLYEHALELAKSFHVLAERIPPKRKPWESEHYSMSMFRALTIAVRSC